MANRQTDQQKITKEVERLRKQVADLENLESVCKEAEHKAADSATRLFMVIERIEEGITFSDDQGHFEIFNSKMGDITGYTMQDVNNHLDFIERLYPDKEELQKALARLNEVVEKGKVENVETMIRTRSGLRKTLLISTVLVHYKNKRMFLTVYRDITERKKVEQLKDEFISMVSHELRTPLSIIKEGMSLIIDGIAGTINEQQRKILLTAKNNIDRLARIINELLDIERLESASIKLRKDTFDIIQLTQETAESFKNKIEGKGLCFTIDIPGRPIQICADSDLIAQVITNLLANSLKFTEKGSITLTLCGSEDMVECAVADTGIGIAKENLPKVFNKFQQFGRVAGPGEKGTGLGLAIAKGIIEMHGGKIRLESELGKGTKIIFSLPKWEVPNG